MTNADRLPFPATGRGPQPGHRSRSAGTVLLAVLVLATAAIATGAWVATSTSSGPPPRFPPVASALTDARAFLQRYVDPTGRVVRRDQGGDTVSEGQAYGLLLAQATGNDSMFRRIWAWTRSHLQLSDGELASLTSPSGAIRDRTPASDADVLAAWALSRARGPNAGYYHAQARRLSRAILGNETVDRGGRLLLAAGPWATGSPASLDPSYWALPAFLGLARFTGDPRWDRLAEGATAVTYSLTSGGSTLPPDWARLDGSVASPTPAPNHQAPQVQYGLDAQRLVVWMASSCDSRSRALAARWWPILSRAGRSSAIALTPAGGRINGATNALPLIASAAAAGAAGDQPVRDRLLAQARAVQAKYPTYYGGAWLGLGEVLLGTGRLGGCGPEKGAA
jgi:hypothetical protein